MAPQQQSADKPAKQKPSSDHSARTEAQGQPDGEVFDSLGSDQSADLQMQPRPNAVVSRRILPSGGLTPAQRGMLQLQRTKGNRTAIQRMEIAQSTANVTNYLQREPPENPPASPASNTPAESASAGPTDTAMSVSMFGLDFTPSAESKYAKGEREQQGLAIILKRLIGQNYTAGMENEVEAFLNSKGVSPSGTLTGNSPGNEKITRIHVDLSTSLLIVDWIEKKKIPVSLSKEQRDILTLGDYSAMAWKELRIDKIAEEVGFRLPAWVLNNQALFSLQLSQDAAVLRQFQKAMEAFTADKSDQNRTAVIEALQAIVTELNKSDMVLDIIRGDKNLITHPMYLVLWPPKGADGEEAPKERTTTAAPDETPDMRVAPTVLAFIRTQPDLSEHVFDDSTAPRKELLDRCLRFLGRALGSSRGDQKISEHPGMANTPPLPSRLDAVPALGPMFDVATLTDHPFVMKIEFTDVFDAFASYSYRWERVRIPDKDILGKGDQNSPPQKDPSTPGAMPGATTPTMGEVASNKYTQVGRYNAADRKRLNDSDVIWAINAISGGLGQVGIGPSTLTEANNILRYVGATIQLGFEIMATPAHEKHVVFNEPGFYIIRCQALPIGKDSKAEMVRPPSVAYTFAFARPALDITEGQVKATEAAKNDSKNRLKELRQMLAEPVSHPNQMELEKELKDLEKEFGSSTKDQINDQIALLEQRKKELQPDPFEYKRIDEAIKGLRQRLEVNEKRDKSHGMAGAERLNASFITDQGQSIPLSMDAVPKESSGNEMKYYVSDLTTPNSDDATGTGTSKEAAITAAIKTILEGIHGYGRGNCSMMIDGKLVSLRIEASVGSIMMEALENISTAASIAIVAAAPFTGGASLSLLLPIGLIGAIPSAYRLATRAEAGTLRLDMNSVMDIVNIAGGFIGAAQAATPIRMVRLGNALMYTGFGVNGLGVLVMGAGVVQQIDALKNDESLSEGMRLAKVMDVVAQFMMNIGIMAGTTLAERAKAKQRASAHEYEQGLHSSDQSGKGTGGTKEGNKVKNYLDEPKVIIADPEMAKQATQNQNPRARIPASVEPTRVSEPRVPPDPAQYPKVKDELKGKRWQDVIRATDAQGTEGKAFGDQMLNFRDYILEQLKKRFKGEPAGTASVERTSDVDVNMMGENAGQNMKLAEQWLIDNVGPEYRDMLRLDLLMDNSRSTRYLETVGSLPASEQREVGARVSNQAEVLNLARMMKTAEHAATPELREQNMKEIQQMEQQMGLSQSEMSRISEMAKKKVDPAAVNEINVRIDTLEAQMKAAADPATKAQLAEQISMLQMEANFAMEAAYISPGAIQQTVQGKAITPELAYQAALSHLEQFYHAIGEAHGDVVQAARGYELYKYMSRFARAAEAANIKTPETNFFKNVGDYIYRTNREANRMDPSGMSSDQFNKFLGDQHSDANKHADKGNTDKPFYVTDPQAAPTDAQVKSMVDKFRDYVKNVMPTMRDTAIKPPAGSTQSSGTPGVPPVSGG